SRNAAACWAVYRNPIPASVSWLAICLFSRLESEPVGDGEVVLIGVSEQRLARPAPAVVEVGVVLPGEADPTVDLDVLGGHPPIGATAVSGRHAGGDRELAVPRGQAGRGVARRGPRELDALEHLDAAVR